MWSFLSNTLPSKGINNSTDIYLMFWKPESVPMGRNQGVWGLPPPAFYRASVLSLFQIPAAPFCASWQLPLSVLLSFSLLPLPCSGHCGWSTPYRRVSVSSVSQGPLSCNDQWMPKRTQILKSECESLLRNVFPSVSEVGGTETWKVEVQRR